MGTGVSQIQHAVKRLEMMELFARTIFGRGGGGLPGHGCVGDIMHRRQEFADLILINRFHVIYS
jgi:hypothetical protein